MVIPLEDPLGIPLRIFREIVVGDSLGEIPRGISWGISGGFIGGLTMRMDPRWGIPWEAAKGL